MGAGRVEVIRSDIRRRDLRLIIAAVEGYSNRVFKTGIAELPSAIGQCGLGSRKKVSKELASQAELFASSLQEFLCRHLPPAGWNVILGGRMGFAIRGKHQASAVLRAIAGEKDCPASSRNSCVLLIYRAPSAVGEIPKWLMDSKEERLIETTSTSVIGKASGGSEAVEELDSESDRDVCESESESGAIRDSNDHEEALIEEEIVNNEGGKENENEAKLRSASLGRSDSLVKVSLRSFSAMENPHSIARSSPSELTCPMVINDWGFLQLSSQTQRRKLMDALERIGSKYESSQNIQQLAQSLRDELMVLSGPLWHVFVAREDLQVKTGGTPIVQFAADWFMPKSNSTSFGKLRVVGFQLCGSTSSVNQFWEKFTQISPYAATALLCLFWMLKSRLCNEDGADIRKNSPFQEMLAARLCGHQGLEVTTALLFCLLIAVAITKVVRRLL